MVYYFRWVLNCVRACSFELILATSQEFVTVLNELLLGAKSKVKTTIAVFKCINLRVKGVISSVNDFSH